MIDTVRRKTGSVSIGRASNEPGTGRHTQLLLAVPGEDLDGDDRGHGMTIIMTRTIGKTFAAKDQPTLT